MDDEVFDRWTRVLTRRRMSNLAAAGGLMTMLGVADRAEAKKKKKKRKKKKGQSPPPASTCLEAGTLFNGPCDQSLCCSLQCTEGGICGSRCTSSVGGPCTSGCDCGNGLICLFDVCTET